MIYSILNEEPQKVSNLRPDVPPKLEQIVYKALSKKKEERFASAQELGADLRLVLESQKPARSTNQDQRKRDDGKARKMKSTSSIKKRGVFISVMVALLIVLLCLVFKTIQKKTTSLSRPKVTRLTSYERDEAFPALSADGRRIAYSWRSERGDYDIYTKVIGEEGHIPFTSDSTYEISATWSHDGNYIAFVRFGENGGIYYKSIFGGVEKKLADITIKWGHPDMLVRVDWSPDGQWLVYNDYDSVQHTNYLFRLNRDSGEREQITFSAPGLIGDMYPKFSPDGHWVAFERASGIYISELYIINLDNHKLRQLTHDRKRIDDLAWTRNGRKIVFVSHREGIPRLWSVDIHGGQPQPLGIGGDGAYTISIARNSHRLVYATMQEKTDIWQAEIPADSGLIKPHRLISSPYCDLFPMYSPDEQKIAFNSDRSGNDEIYTCNRDGTNIERITTIKSHSGVPRWSPSGDNIIFDSRPKGNSDILKVDAQGTAPPDNLTDHPADDRIPTWSRDGQYIYFGSKRSDEYQIYKMSVDGGEPVPITQNEGGFGFESYDGDCFYYKKYQHSGRSIHQINLATMEDSVAVEEYVWAFRWSVEKDGIYYIPWGDIPVLKLYYPNTGKVKILGTFEEWFALWDVSNDGSRILLWRFDDMSGDIYMVDDFH